MLGNSLYLHLRMNKTDLIRTLKDLDTLSQEQKAYLIDLVNTKKKYGLVWEDKPEDVEELLRQHLPVLTEVPERRILASAAAPVAEVPADPAKSEKTKPKEVQATLAFAATPDASSGEGFVSLSGVEDSLAPDHILIEGDNLHALTALTFTHEGRVDVIYIDPPYNTGNKDFKYNDRFVDREDSYRHSKWLSFMHKRLLIAKRLLAETGVIFISIDDNEQAQLKMLCDEIFGEENFLVNMIWQKMDSPSSNFGNRFFSNYHDHTLIFAKNIKNCDLQQLPKPEILDAYPELDKDGKRIRLRQLRKNGKSSRRKDRPTMWYKIIAPDGSEVWPIDPKEGWEGRWAIGQDTYNQLAKNDEIIWKQREKGWVPYSIEMAPESPTVPNPSILTDVGQNRQAKAQLNEVLGNDHKFDTPKPVGLVKRIFQIFNRNNALILDFFAGSGTTLHATMQLNAEDGGNRQCILVTNNENNIAEEVCYERNRRVIQGYQNPKGQEVAGLTNNSLRYYRCETVPSARTEQNRRLLTRQSTELLKIKEGCYADITEASGFDPATCYVGTNERGKYTVVLYHNRRPQPLIAALGTFIQALPDRREKVRLYAFSEEKDALLADFQAVADVIEGVPLPEAIYNAYRATFRTLGLDKKPPQTPETESEEAETDAEQTSLEFSSQNN